MPGARLRRHLATSGLAATVIREFGAVPGSIKLCGFGPACCPACALAVFTLKFPSLLRIDTAMRNREEPTKVQNLNSQFKVEAVPSDTCMRRRQARIEVRQLRGCFNAVIDQV